MKLDFNYWIIGFIFYTYMSNNGEDLRCMSHTSLFTSHLFHKFKSKVSFILNQHNKHLIFLTEIHFERACKHAHMELFRNSAQCMVSIVGEKGNFLICCNIKWLCSTFQTINILFSFQARWLPRLRA
jgi:hypothetical protein